MRKNLFSLFLFFILVNCTFWFSALWLNIHRPIFNLDYTLLLFVPVFTGSWLLISLLVFCFLLLDLINSYASFYGFSDWEFISKIPWLFRNHLINVNNFNSAHGVFIIASIFPLIFFIYYFKKNRQLINSKLIIVCFFILLICDQLNGSGGLKIDKLLFNINLSQFNVGKIVYAGVKQAKASKELVTANIPKNSYATAYLIDELASQSKLPQNIVLILVESWGKYRDETIEKNVENILSKPSVLENYSIRQGSIPTRGSTIWGELRELCGKFSTQPISALYMSNNCLPQILKEKGYQTYALHGFDGSFYEREFWYPKIGFDNNQFRNDFPNSTMCAGAFPGVCDNWMMNLINITLHSKPNEKKFIYWVTLNTHLPLPNNNQPCPTYLNSFDDETLCGYAKAIEKTLNSISLSLEDSSLKNTRWIIVGDHPPPFVTQSRKKLFKTQEVPYIELIPKFQS